MADFQRYEPLEPIETDQFLPPIGLTVTLGSWFIVLALCSAIAASFSVKYRTTVKAAAVIRPDGETRLVQALTAGNVIEITVQNNAPVKKGDVIAKLDTTSLEARAEQLFANLEQGQRRLAQAHAQLQTIDQQVAAEAVQAQRTVAASVAEYNQVRRNNLNQSVSAQAAVEEAQAQLELAAREVDSFRQLVASGAASQLQFYEKQAALDSARARMVSLQAALDPSPGDMQAARERVFQAEAGGTATLARLKQSKQQLIQQGLEIEEQLENTEQEIAQMSLSLQNSVLRSPITGTLHNLSLRNTGQVITSGETVAQVIPADIPVSIKAMIPASQINRVDTGMPAQMRVSACPFSEFGTAAGTVTSISPDTMNALAASDSDEAPRLTTPDAFYSVTIEPEESVLTTVGGRTCQLQPGTEGRVTIVSRTETAITFLRRKVGLMIDF